MVVQSGPMDWSCTDDTTVFEKQVDAVLESVGRSLLLGVIWFGSYQLRSVFLSDGCDEEVST